MKNRGIWMGAICFGAALAMIAILSVIYGQSMGKGGGMIFGVAGGSLSMNEVAIPVDMDTELSIDYRSQNIQIKEGNSGEIVIKEYLWKKRSPAEITASEAGGRKRVTVTGDQQVYLMFFGFITERIEVYLPREMIKKLDVKTTSGNINSTDITLNVDEVRLAANSGNIETADIRGSLTVKATSGSIDIAHVGGDAEAKANSGNIEIASTDGNADMKATSGNIKIGTVAGRLNANANSGNISAELITLQDSVKLKTTSGNVTLVMPKNNSFAFEAKTTSGGINTYFDGELSYNKNGNHASGNIGGQSDLSISLQAISGNIKVKK